MPTAMVTFNGRVTLPSQVRKELGLKTGDNLDFVEVEKGRFAICMRPGSGTDRKQPNAKLEFATAFKKMDQAPH